MTLKELYQQQKASDPGQKFVRDLMDITKKSEATVRRWLSHGPSSCAPDALTQEVLAKHFDTTPEELFPRQ